jgi:hypothetical protein
MKACSTHTNDIIDGAGGYLLVGVMTYMRECEAGNASIRIGPEHMSVGGYAAQPVDLEWARERFGNFSLNLSEFLNEGTIYKLQKEKEFLVTIFRHPLLGIPILPPGLLALWIAFTETPGGQPISIGIALGVVALYLTPIIGGIIHIAVVDPTGELIVIRSDGHIYRIPYNR